MSFGNNNTDPAQPSGQETGLLEAIKQHLQSFGQKSKSPENAETLSILTQGVHTALQTINGISQKVENLSQSVNSMQGQMQQFTANPAAPIPAAGAPAPTPAPVGTGTPAGTPASAGIGTPAAPVSHTVQTAGAGTGTTTQPVGAPGQQQNMNQQLQPVTLEGLAQQILGMQQQLQTMSTTVVNGAPAAGTGGAATENTY